MAGTEPTCAKKKGRRKQLLRLAIVVPSVVCFFALLWPEIEQMLQSDGTNAVTGNCPLFLQDNSSNSSNSTKGGKCPLGLSDSGLPNPHTKSEVDDALGLVGAGDPDETTADRPAADSTAEVTAPPVEAAPMTNTEGLRTYTEDELARYDGTDQSLPVLLSYRSRVYDVSAEATSVYGPGMSYSKFAGRACTRGVALPSLEDLDVTDVIADFSAEQMKQVTHWEKFYRDKYEQVGTLIPDPDHSQKVALRAAAAAAKRLAEEQAKVAKASQVRDVVGKLLSRTELAKFDGSQSELPIYLSVGGHVLDMTGSSNLFGKGKPRGCWTGRDSTIAIIQKTCDPKHLFRHMGEASADELKQLESSLSFFLSKYPKVGTLVTLPLVNDVKASLTSDQQHVQISWQPLTTASQATAYVVFAQHEIAQPLAVSEPLATSTFRSQRAIHLLPITALSSKGKWQFYVSPAREHVRGELSVASNESQLVLS